MGQPKPKPPQTVWDLPRNDIRACVAFYRAHGGVTGEEMSVMLRLQDDSTELMRIAMNWKQRHIR